jgi:hypothetical protein
MLHDLHHPLKKELVMVEKEAVIQAQLMDLRHLHLMLAVDVEL